VVVRLQNMPAVSGAAASLFTSAADLSVESARMQAQGLSSLGSGLESAAQSYTAAKQRKFENARQTQRDTMDATYKQYEMDHGSAALMADAMDREQKAMFDAVQSGDKDGFLAHKQNYDAYSQTQKVNLGRIASLTASHGLEIGTDGKAKPMAGVDHG
jgi:hypothetical protein